MTMTIIIAATHFTRNNGLLDVEEAVEPAPRQAVGQQLPHDDAEAVHVARRAVLVALKQLGRKPHQRPRSLA